MEAFICKTCGVQHRPSPEPPDRCIICDDERQYVGWQGQEWTTLGEMRAQGYANELREHERGLSGIATRPHFAIGQRALLVQTSGGNLLWDCITYVDDETVARVRQLGGIQAIAASHPHFYGSMVEWSLAFGGAPVYVPEADAQWAVRRDSDVRYWSGSREVLPGLTLIQCGGHFEGSAVAHWPDGAEGRGVLLTGDTIAVAQDRRYVTFMRSYPNYIPLPVPAIEGIVNAVAGYRFDRIYGGWWTSVVSDGAYEAVRRSAERYVRWIDASSPDG
ncbi:MAG: MBL fold metallo-hydrolase [Dehalococcoidia bacterium]|nr:MAG: MBL fold metallo-hydrolase [Dehalococcoidia bacterium]